jgi:hypothetical protein
MPLRGTLLPHRPDATYSSWVGAVFAWEGSENRDLHRVNRRLGFSGDRLLFGPRRFRIGDLREVPALDQQMISSAPDTLGPVPTSPVIREVIDGF